MEIIEKASKVYWDNFNGEAWFGRCIFLSWYCGLGSCKFCYRAINKGHNINREKARRSLNSILVETLLCKKLNWRLEFLTSGYDALDIDELLEICKEVSRVYGKKIWLNVGVLSEEDLNKLKRYVGGIVASIETCNRELHKRICPDKKFEEYEKMLKIKGFKKGATIVIGLGEKKEDFLKLKNFIEKYKLDKITFYALKPIRDGFYSEGPDRDYYAWWIANTRVNFPKLEIMAGVTVKRVEDVDILLKSGANGITKFPITKCFSSEKTKLFEELVKKSGRTMISKLNDFNGVDFSDVDENIKEKLEIYLNKMGKKI